MNRPDNQTAEKPEKPRYTWPWFVLAAVLLAIVLAILWVRREVARTRNQREWNTPTAPSRP